MVQTICMILIEYDPYRYGDGTSCHLIKTETKSRLKSASMQRDLSRRGFTIRREVGMNQNRLNDILATMLEQGSASGWHCRNRKST